MEGRSGRVLTDTESRFVDRSLVRGAQGASHLEVQDLNEEETAGSDLQSKDGVFKRLRKRLSSFSRHLSQVTSPTNVVHLDPFEVRRNGVIITQIQRRPFYRCVPLPPGCFPPEVMHIAKNQNLTSSSSVVLTEFETGKKSAEIHGTKKIREQNKRGRVGGNGASNAWSGERDGLPNVLYNNWVDPEL